AARRPWRDPAERSDEGLPIAERDRLLQERRGGEDARLDLPGRNLLAVLQLEDAVGPAVELQAEARPLAQIAGVEPAALEGARSLCRPAAIPAHYLRAAHEDLAGAGGRGRDRVELHCRSRQRPAHDAGAARLLRRG